MAARDLDEFHKDRLKPISKEIWEAGLDTAKLFTSEKVFLTIDQEKVFLSSYRQDEVLTMLPFTSTLYVAVCRNCITQERFEGFKTLVERGIIIPVLTNPYKYYPEKVVDVVASHDHMSSYEYNLYRGFSIRAENNKWACEHCVAKRSEQALEYVKNDPDLAIYKRMVDRIRYDLSPFVQPDFKLLDAVVAACKKQNLKQLQQLEDIGDGIYRVRTAQAFYAPIMLKSQDLEHLPNGLVSNTDELLHAQTDLRKFAADGLGLKIPTDIGVENYVELLSDYRPEISKIVSDITAGDMRHDNIVSMLDVQKQVMRINRDIERIKGLRRTVVLDACVGFYKERPQLINSILIMAALGLTGNLWGCATAGTVQAGRAISKKISKKKEENKSVSRLKNTVERDVRPHIEKLVASYVGSDVPTVSVLSIQRSIAQRVESLNRRKLPTA